VGAGAAAQQAYVDKCLIDIGATSPQCTLSKGNDQAVWVNKTAEGVYICGSPTLTPFETYAWYVPANDKRRSGKIRDDITPGGTQYSFYPSDSACKVPPAKKTHPKIIIVGN